MLEFLFDPQFYWPYMALLLLSFLFAYVGARAVFHPEHFLAASHCFTAQLAALTAAAALWGYLGYRFGLNASFIAALSAWLACCAGTRRGGRPIDAGDEGNLFTRRREVELARPAREDLG